jgi:hypothetical protein
MITNAPTWEDFIEVLEREQRALDRSAVQERGGQKKRKRTAPAKPWLKQQTNRITTATRPSQKKTKQKDRPYGSGSLKKGLRFDPQDTPGKKKNSKQARRRRTKPLEGLTSVDEESTSEEESSDDESSIAASQRRGYVQQVTPSRFKCTIMVDKCVCSRFLKTKQEAEEWLATIKANPEKVTKRRNRTWPVPANRKGTTGMAVMRIDPPEVKQPLDRSFEHGSLKQLKKRGWMCKIVVGKQFFCRTLKSEQEGREWLAVMRACPQEELGGRPGVHPRENDQLPQEISENWPSKGIVSRELKGECRKEVQDTKSWHWQFNSTEEGILRV